MYETHNPGQDRADVFAGRAQRDETPPGLNAPSDVNEPGSGQADRAQMETIPEHEGDQETYLGEESPYDCADIDGLTYLPRPKRQVNGRNQPGQMIAATRGSIANFKGYKNGKGRRKEKENSQRHALFVALAISDGRYARFLIVRTFRSRKTKSDTVERSGWQRNFEYMGS